jgi:hypothetical protein
VAETFTGSNQGACDGGTQDRSDGSDPAWTLPAQNAAVLVLKRSAVILADAEINRIEFLQMRVHGGSFLPISVACHVCLAPEIGTDDNREGGGVQTGLMSLLGAAPHSQRAPFIPCHECLRGYRARHRTPGFRVR